MLPLLKIAFCTALLGAFSVNATDWSQWRGAQRDGAAPGAPWAASLAGIELQWRVPLGKGYPGPVVGGDRVFVVETIDKKTVGVRALSRATGQQLWQVTWSGKGNVPFFAKANGDWVRSTPAWDGETLYVGDMAEVVVALDGATGAERWRVDFPRRYETPVPDFGFASSPLVVGDFLYVQAANSLVKLDKRTGQAVWRSLVIEEGMASNGAFSSPVLEVLAGREQLVALNRESLYGLDPENGQVLWSKPLPHFRGMHILTPTIWRDAIFTSPYRERSYLIDLSSEGEDWRVAESWQNKASGYMSSPVVVDDHLYLLLGNGRIECIELATGQSRWRSSRSFGKYLSMVWRQDRILALDGEGTLYLFAANPERFELLDEREVAQGSTWGHLAVSGDELFVRELQAIVSLRWARDDRASAD